MNVKCLFVLGLIFIFQTVYLNDTYLNTPEYEAFENCDCLPSCYSLDYETESSHANFVLLENLLATKMVNIGKLESEQ